MHRGVRATRESASRVPIMVLDHSTQRNTRTYAHSRNGGTRTRTHVSRLGNCATSETLCALSYRGRSSRKSNGRSRYDARFFSAVKIPCTPEKLRCTSRSRFNSWARLCERSTTRTWMAVLSLATSACSRDASENSLKVVETHARAF